jgi:hypothetical protein
MTALTGEIVSERTTFPSFKFQRARRAVLALHSTGTLLKWRNIIYSDTVNSTRCRWWLSFPGGMVLPSAVLQGNSHAPITAESKHRACPAPGVETAAGISFP